MDQTPTLVSPSIPTRIYNT